VCLANGFAEAVRLADLSVMDVLGKQMREMEKTLCERFPGLIVVGYQSPRLPNTASLLMAPLKSETQLMQLDLADICIGAGSACSSGRIAPSHVLTGMGYAPDVAACAIRISAGWQTTEDDLRQFADVWSDIIGRALKRAA
jgi:cysteine desulfurase